MFVVMRLHKWDGTFNSLQANTTENPLAFKVEIKPDAATMVGWLAVYATREDALKEYPHAALQEIEEAKA